MFQPGLQFIYLYALEKNGRKQSLLGYFIQPLLGYLDTGLGKQTESVPSYNSDIEAIHTTERITRNSHALTVICLSKYTLNFILPEGPILNLTANPDCN